jgi:hypothetical protein
MSAHDTGHGLAIEISSRGNLLTVTAHPRKTRISKRKDDGQAKKFQAN